MGLKLTGTEISFGFREGWRSSCLTSQRSSKPRLDWKLWVGGWVGGWVAFCLPGGKPSLSNFFPVRHIPLCGVSLRIHLWGLLVSLLAIQPIVQCVPICQSFINSVWAYWRTRAVEQGFGFELGDWVSFGRRRCSFNLFFTSQPVFGSFSWFLVWLFYLGFLWMWFMGR